MVEEDFIREFGLTSDELVKIQDRLITLKGRYLKLGLTRKDTDPELLAEIIRTARLKSQGKTPIWIQ